MSCQQVVQRWWEHTIRKDPRNLFDRYFLEIEALRAYRDAESNSAKRTDQSLASLNFMAMAADNAHHASSTQVCYCCNWIVHTYFIFDVM